MCLEENPPLIPGCTNGFDFIIVKNISIQKHHFHHIYFY